MPKPENWEEIKNSMDLAGGIALMKKSYQKNDMVLVNADGVDLEGKIVSIDGEKATVETKYCTFVRKLGELSYSEPEVSLG